MFRSSPSLPVKIMPPRTVAETEKGPAAHDKSTGPVIRPPITVEDFAVIKPPRTVAETEKGPAAHDKSTGPVIRESITMEDFAVKKRPRVVFAFDTTGSRKT